MPGALVAVTGRRGGVSAAPFESLNVGFGTGDDDDDVRRNQDSVRAAFRGPPLWARVDQVHGSVVLPVPDVDTRRDTQRAVLLGVGDAMVTTRDDVTLAIFTADCAPVAFVAGGVVAAAHAGWRGLLGGVLASTVHEIRRAEPSAPIRAVLGPCIRPCCYEFGEAELALFAGRFGAEVEGRTRAGARSLDLPRAIGLELERLKVVGWDEADTCTACSPDFYSYRRDGLTGRQVMLVARA